MRKLAHVPSGSSEPIVLAEPMSISDMVGEFTVEDIAAMRASSAWYDAYEASIIYPARKPALSSGPSRFRFIPPKPRLPPIRTKRV